MVTSVRSAGTSPQRHHESVGQRAANRIARLRYQLPVRNGWMCLAHVQRFTARPLLQRYLGFGAKPSARARLGPPIKEMTSVTETSEARQIIGGRRESVLRSWVHQEVRVQIDVIVAVSAIKNGRPSSMPSPSNHPAIASPFRLCSVGRAVRGVGNCRRMKCTRQPKIGIVSKTTVALAQRSRATRSAARHRAADHCQC